VKKLSLAELGRVDVKTFKGLNKLSLVVLLDNIRSGHNVGAVFRSSDAFLIEKIILCGITPVPPHREINKSAIGSTASVDWVYEADAKEVVLNYKERGYEIVGIEQTDESVILQNYSVDSSKKYLIIMGNEVGGISDDLLPLLDVAIEIPQYGTKHSLNVSVCAGVVLWEFFRGMHRIH